MLILLIFSQFFRRELFEGIEVEGTFLVNAFMDVEMLTVLLFNKDVSAVRAYKSTDFKVFFILVEPETTDFTQELTTATCIVVEVVMGCTTTMAYTIRGYRLSTTGFDRLEILSVLYSVLLKQKDVIKLFRLLDDGKLIDS